MKHWLTTFSLLFLFDTLFAQAPAMADTLRSEGKIYVVVGVVVLIFAVLFSYMIYLDLKLRKAEKERQQ